MLLANANSALAFLRLRREIGKPLPAGTPG